MNCCTNKDSVDYRCRSGDITKRTLDVIGHRIQKDERQWDLGKDMRHKVQGFTLRKGDKLESQECVNERD